MQNTISRRSLIKQGIVAGALVPFLGIANFEARAASLPALDPNDSTAKALGFVPDASKVDVATNTSFKPTQKCATCAQFQGKAGDASGGCNIFAGKSVPAGGWCKVWVQKS